MRWGIDLGGTKIEGIILPDEPNAEPILRHRILTESARGYLHILERIDLLVEEMATRSGVARPEAIGIGTPGTSDPETGLQKNSNTTCLNGMPFRADLSDRLGMEVFAANDANCFALAEAQRGAGRGYETCFGIIMGTGVGGGLVVNGQVLGGAHGIAGEWGHNVLDPTGPLAYSGRRGVVESIISGPALERFYRQCTGDPLALEQIARRAETGDLAAQQTMIRLAEMFGRAVANVVNIFDPHVIVVGGGVSNLPVLYREGVARIAEHVFNPVFRTPVVPAALGDSAGVYGAAYLVPESFL